MTPKEKAMQGLAPGTALDTTFTERNSTRQNPFQGWYDLAKPSRNRQQKRSWKRGNQRGHIDAYLLSLLALMFVSALLIVGGLS